MPHWHATLADVSTDAIERLGRVDYRPHTARRWPLSLGAVGAASGTAVVASVVILGGTQPAFAGWNATPTMAADGSSTPPIATPPADCQGRLATVPGGPGQAGWTRVANDVRGPYTMTVYDDGDSLASCFTGPSFSTVEVESLTAAQSSMAVAVSGSSASSGTTAKRSATSSSGGLFSGGGVDALLVSHLSQAGNGAFTLAEGRLEPGASAVTLVLSNGQDVTASAGSGWLVAWWPGTLDVTAAKVTTAGGTTTDALNSCGRFPPPDIGPASGANSMHVAGTTPPPPLPTCAP